MNITAIYNLKWKIYTIDNYECLSLITRVLEELAALIKFTKDISQINIVFDKKMHCCQSIPAEIFPLTHSYQNIPAKAFPKTFPPKHSSQTIPTITL